jgi:hypothetical protein
MPQGTVTRLAALKLLEQLRPQDTVTICMPLFLAGGEGDRAFARFYPTIAVDGCELRCAARATEMYSGKPAASLVVNDLVQENNLQPPTGSRRLDPAGKQAVEVTAQRMAEMVDNLLGSPWSRRSGEAAESGDDSQTLKVPVIQEEVQATCSCGSGIPIQKVAIDGNVVTLVGLPLIFQQFREAGKPPSDAVQRELYDTVKIYNPIPTGEAETYAYAILREYAAYCEKETAR